VALLYGDDIRQCAPSTSDLGEIGEALGDAFTRILKDHRKETL
jgi:hypothetical protein